MKHNNLSHFIICALMLLMIASPSFAQKDTPENLRYFKEIYKDLHSHPELSFKETRTAGIVADELRKMGFEVTENFGKTAVVGLLRNGDGPVIMLRTDMDALPIKENTGLDFASTVTTLSDNVTVPVFHACGHDMHATVFLGTLKSLIYNKKLWKGTLIALCQPAEEIGLGALSVINAGLFTKYPKPKYAFAYHVNPDVPAGKIAFTSGPALAGVRDYNITFHGKCAHGAYPQESIDPIIMACTAVLEFQTIASRSVNVAEEDVVVTVGHFEAGTRPNIIPSTASLQLTTRFFSTKAGDLIQKRITEICNGIALSMGMPADQMPDITMYSPLPPLINNPELTSKTVTSMRAVLGKDNVIPKGKNMVAEDFAFYGTNFDIQTVMLWLGVGPTTALHSPTMTPDFDNAFPVGVRAMTAAIIDRFNEKL